MSKTLLCVLAELKKDSNPVYSRSLLPSLLCLLAIHTCVIAAQTPSTPSPQIVPEASTPIAPTLQGHAIPLSIHQAVQLALKENSSVLIARLLTLQRQKDKAASLSNLLPQSTFASNAGVKRFNQQSIIGNEEPVRVGPYQVINIGGGFSQELLNLPLVRRYQVSRENVRTAESQSRVTREQIVSAVVAQYLSVLRAVATYRAATVRRDLADRLYRQAMQLRSSGVGTSLDELRAKVELQNEKQRLIDAEATAKAATYELTALLDLPPDEEAQVTEEMNFESLPDPSSDKEFTKALAQRPEIRTILSQERAAHLNKSAIMLQRLPSLSFSGSYFYQARTIDTGIPAYNYTGSINFPLWTSGRIHAEIGKADLEEQRLSEEKREIETSIHREVKTAVELLQAARNAVQVANEGYSLAEQEVAQAQRRFAAGVATNIEVTSAQDALARASDNQIEALYRFNQSRADLARATGEAENIYAR